MRDTYKDLIIGSRMRMLELYRSEVHFTRKQGETGVGTFGRGMIAGLRLALLHMRWLHREIRSKEEQGYSLVWIDEDELKILDQYHG